MMTPLITHLLYNTIITSLKPFDKSFTSRNHVRKFLRDLPTKWRSKVMAIEESKDLSTLPLDELIGNLKVYEVVLEKDSKASKFKKEKYKSLALKARKVSSDEEESCSKSDEEYVTAVRDFKKFFRRRGKFVRQPQRRQVDFLWKDQGRKEGIRTWSESDEEDEYKRDEICLMELSNNEVRLKVKLQPDEWINNNGCLRHMTVNKDLFSTYEAINGDHLTKFDPKSTEGVFLGYSPNNKAYIILNKETMRIEESLNVRFDDSPPPKSSPLVDDDIIESQIIENHIEDIEVKENGPLNKEIINIKDSKDHPIEK
ncbi:zf-CCHC domain-containing protein, partial [Tanacetum coccineum]